VLPVNLFTSMEPLAGNFLRRRPNGPSVAVRDIVCHADGRMVAKRCLIDEGRADRG
jgi:hypothetical protein